MSSTYLPWKITKVLDQAGAGTGTTTTTGVDMQGWENVTYLTSFGTAAANNLVHIEQGTDNDSNWDDVANSEMGDATSEDIVLTLIKPDERYNRMSITLGTSSAMGDVWAIQWNGHVTPVNNETTGTQLCLTLTEPRDGTK